MKKYLLLLAFALVMLSSKATGHYVLHTWTYGGLSREYYLYVPSSYDSTKPMPFVLVLHGLGDTISNFIGINMNLVADTGNFIFAVPQAITDPTFGYSAWNSGTGYLGIQLNPTVDDVGFLNAIIDSTQAYYNLDQTRLYCTGFSMGGFMTNRLGCELNNRIAAIASVSGTIGTYLTCNPTRVVPACHFHGTNDQVVYYTGDMFGMDPEVLVAYWRAHDGCDSVPIIDTLPKVIPDTLTFIHYIYPNGEYGSDVEFYKVVNGTHEWIYEPNMNYSVAIWQFFYKHKWVPQVNAINEVPVTVDMKIFPNPANDALNIEYTPNGLTTQPELMITDLTGRVVFKSELSVSQGTQQIETKNWAAGSYTYNVRNNENGVVARGIFVVAH
jgi:polyhydroxybutyrate depolymerase